MQRHTRMPLLMMKSESPASSSNKITDIVRLQQILKKWKKLVINRRRSSTEDSAATVADTTAAAAAATSKGGSISVNKFLKKTPSFSENVPPKGYVAVCVGEELKRFVIPMEYLGHHSFAHLLREAEEEFGFQQEGVLKFPCQVPVFHSALKIIADAQNDNDDATPSPTLTGYCQQHHHPAPPQMCR